MQSDVELVRDIVDALNRGDVDGMLEHMHPEFEWRPLEASPVASVYRGHAEVRGYVEDWLSTLESIRLDLEEPAEVAGRVVTGVHAHGRGRASGLALDTRFCQVWTLHAGTAIRMDEYETREDALAAIA